ncbi:MAG: hypothetical protein WBN06_06980, partial [Lysobacterales bacterium]
MNRHFSQASYPLGLTLFALFLAIYKSTGLMKEMGAGGTTFLNIIGLDALFLSLLFLIALLQSRTQLKSLRIVCLLILFSLTLFYLVDSFV